MTGIREREITKEQHREICEDFVTEIRNGVPQRKQERYSFTAEEDGVLIGYVSGITEHRWFYLTDLWVEESRRRQGIGSELLKKMEERAKAAGMEHVYLWTAGPDNPKFYEKHGYRVFAVLEDLYELEGYHQQGYRKDL